MRKAAYEHCRRHRWHPYGSIPLASMCPPHYGDTSIFDHFKMRKIGSLYGYLRSPKKHQHSGLRGIEAASLSEGLYAPAHRAAWPS